MSKRIRRSAWNLLWCVPVAVLLVPALTAPARAQSGERLSDRDVKALIDEVDKARDRFEDQLDSKLKSSILRGPSGEVSVEAYLDDLQENVKRLKDRFNTTYAASKEAETVLRQGSDIHRYIKAQPAELKGGSEWDSMARGLERLAGAYHTTFPLPVDAPVRRISDNEAATSADQLAKGADQLKKQLDKEKALPKPVVDAAKKDVDALGKQAKVVKSRVNESKPATAEMRELLDHAAKVGTFVQGQSGLLPGTTGAWGALKDPLDKLQQAYGLRLPPPQP
jgi:hypothetical protein